MILTQPVQAAGQSFREGRQFPPELSKPTDSKVKGLVLARIEEATADGRAALLPSATAPRIVIDLLAALAVPSVEESRREERIEWMPSSRPSKRAPLRRALGRKIPIGLRRCDPHGWVNSWIQFLLSIPGLLELFSFAPRSFDPFREFVDQYDFDQMENRSVSSANSASLVRCLMRNLPLNFFKNPLTVDLYEILRASFKAMFSQTSPSCSVAFRSEWHLVWNANSAVSLEEEIKKKMEGRPPELLVAIKGWDPASCRLIKREHVSHPDWHFYDLDAFIEHRPDGRNGGSFIAYVKIEGSWYQCDDDRICSVRSTILSIPLHRSVLLHYKRLVFGKSGWI